MSTIDRAEVERIAHLSRLELDEASLDAMTSHMKNMLGFVASLDRHDTKGVSAEKPPLRPDRVRPSLAPDEALAMAPAKGKDGFKVPGVVDRVEG